MLPSASHTVDHAEWLSLAGIEATLLLLAGEEIAALCLPIRLHSRRF